MCTVDVFPMWSISSVWVFCGGWKAVTPETNGHFSFPVRSCWRLSLCTCKFWCPHSVPAKPHYLLSIYAPCQADINFCFNIVVNKRKNDLAVWGRTAQTILKHGRWQRKRSFSAAPITWSKDLHKGERQALEENWGRPTDEHCISQQAGTCCCAPSTPGSILWQTRSCSWEQGLMTSKVHLIHHFFFSRLPYKAQQWLFLVLYILKTPLWCHETSLQL